MSIIKNLKKVNIIVFILLLVWSQFNLFLALPVKAQETKKMVLISIDKMSLNDLMNTKTPHMDHLIEQGTVGLMNTRTAGSRTSSNCFTTLGAGNYGVAYNKESLISMKATEIYNGEPAKNYVLRNTGKAVPENSIVNIGIAQLKTDNFHKSPGTQPGRLGTVLKNNNIKIALFGNSDVSNKLQRFLPLMLMDENGLVSEGDVSRKTLIDNDKAPFGIKTNYSLLIDQFENYKNNYDLLAYEIGDIKRVEAYKDYVSDDAYNLLRTHTIEQVDDFIGQLSQRVNFENTLFMIVVPSPSKDIAKNGDLLTPLVLAGDGIQKGITTSGSTRREGIITNIDVTATLLHYFNIEPSTQMHGRNITTIIQSEPLITLKALNNQVVTTYNQRRPVLQNFVIIQIIVYLLSLVVIFRLYKFIPVIRFILLWLTSVPLMILLLPLLHIYNTFFLSIMLIALSFLLSLFVVKIFPQSLDGFTVIYLMTAVALIGDLLTGTHLIKTSLFGYDPIIGARFYGIGNEYMGILLGTFILGLTLFLDRKKRDLGRIAKLLIGILLIGIIFLMASSMFGANVGGTISAIVAFIVLYLKILGKKVSRKEIIFIILAVFSVLIAMILLELTRDIGSQSHVGRAFSAIQKNGIKEIITIISRKLAMNIKLIRYSIWSWVLMTGILALAVLFYRPVGVLRKIMISHPYLNSGMIGVITASIVALCVNDSGIVAAATSITYAVAIIIDLIMKEKEIK